MQGLIKRHKELFRFTFLSYVDKAFAFLLPLLVLYVYKDKAVYNSIEYVYSVASIAMVPFRCDFGAFYFYKESADRQRFLAVYRRATNIMLLVMFTVSSLSVAAWHFADSRITLAMGFCIVARMACLIYQTHETAHYRLVDRASRILEISIMISVASLLIVFLAFTAGIGVLIPFFVMGLAVPMIACAKNLGNGDEVGAKELLAFFKMSYTYSWTLIINYILGVFVANFCKIYAFNRLSEEEMYVFSYTVRISLIMQLAYASIVAFYSKRLYLTGYTPRIVAAYLMYMLLGAIGCLVFLTLLNSFTNFAVPVSACTYIILAYNFVYYSAAFMETFFNKRNRNSYILSATAISVAIFIAMITLLDTTNLLYISTAMLIFAAIRLLFYSVKIRLIRKEETT